MTAGTVRSRGSRERTATPAHHRSPVTTQPTHHLPPKHGMAPGVEWVIDYRSHDIHDLHRQWQVLTREPDDVAACVYVPRTRYPATT